MHKNTDFDACRRTAAELRGEAQLIKARSTNSTQAKITDALATLWEKLANFDEQAKQIEELEILILPAPRRFPNQSLH